MNILQQTKLDEAAVGHLALFTKTFELEEKKTLAEKLAMRVDSSGAEENHTWMDAAPGMEEFVDSRKYSQLSAQGIRIVNKEWTSAIKIRIKDLEDDKLGLLLPNIESMAEEAALLYDDRIVELINGMFTGLAYDGQYQCDDDHATLDGVALDNKDTYVLSATSLRRMWAGMAAMKNPRGKRGRYTASHVIFPPSLRATAMALLAERDAAGASNPDYKLVEPLCIPGMEENPAYFALLCLNRRVKPFIKQVRIEPVMEVLNKGTTDSQFDELVIKAGVRMRGEVGYGPWQLIYGSTGVSS